MFTREIIAAHLIVGGRNTGHRIDAPRIFSKRLAERLQRQRDVSTRELGLRFGNPERNRLRLARQRTDGPDRELALLTSASGDRQDRRVSEKFGPPVHLNL